MSEKINDKLKQEIKSFKYLDDLIHSGKKEITLEYDIVLGEDEEEVYKDGIYFDADVDKIDGKGHIIDARRKARIFTVKNFGVNIENLNFKRGMDNSINGLIHLDQVNVIFKNCLFEDNICQNFLITSNCCRKIYLEKCKFNKNTADLTIIYIDSKRFYIRDCSFTDNNTYITDNGYGLIFINKDYSRMIISNTVFSNNNTKLGGAIYIGKNEKLYVNNCIFEDNTAHLSGGAIYNDYGNVLVKDSTFNNNKTESDKIDEEIDCFTPYRGCSSEEIDEMLYIFDEGGGAICNMHGSVSVFNSTFTGNKSKNKGGAVYNRYGTVTIYKLSFIDNQAFRGGDVYNYYGTVTLLDNDADKKIKIYNEYGELVLLMDLDRIRNDENYNYIEAKVVDVKESKIHSNMYCEVLNYDTIKFKK